MAEQETKIIGEESEEDYFEDSDEVNETDEEETPEEVEDFAEEVEEATEVEPEPELDLSTLTVREKIDAALAKITKEAAALNDGDPCKLLISEYLMEKITNGPVAELILARDKKLVELNKKMWDEAKKRKTGNGAHISDTELMQMADEYYGMTAAPAFTESVIDITDLL